MTFKAHILVYLPKNVDDFSKSLKISEFRWKIICLMKIRLLDVKEIKFFSGVKFWLERINLGDW